MNINIRKAEKRDMAAVHALVRELAEYENEPEAVITTVEEYENNFEQGIFQSMVVEMDGEIVGMTLYYTAYSTWKGKMIYLDDFVVRQAFRQYGIGQQLFDALIAECKKQGAKLLKWQVLDWNEPALRFYEKNNATIEKNWWNGKILFI